MDFRKLTAVAALVFVAAPAWAVTTTLDMDTDPVDLGWTILAGGGSHNVSNGILHIDAPSYYEVTAPANVWQNSVGNAGGWTIETRMRRDPTSVGTPGMWIYDGRNLSLVGFHRDSFEISGESAFPGSYGLDTSVFHTYRFEGRRNKLRVFVDDLLALDFDSARDSGASFTFMFGDNNRFTSGPSSSDWDYVSVTTNPVPLPAGFWLAAASIFTLVGLGARRRA